MSLANQHLQDEYSAIFQEITARCGLHTLECMCLYVCSLFLCINSYGDYHNCSSLIVYRVDMLLSQAHELCPFLTSHLHVNFIYLTVEIVRYYVIVD